MKWRLTPVAHPEHRGSCPPQICPSNQDIQIRELPESHVPVELMGQCGPFKWDSWNSLTIEFLEDPKQLLRGLIGVPQVPSMPWAEAVPHTLRKERMQCPNVPVKQRHHTVAPGKLKKPVPIHRSPEQTLKMDGLGRMQPSARNQKENLLFGASGESLF